MAKSGPTKGVNAKGVAKAQNLPKSVAGNGAPSVFAAFMPHDIETLAKIVIGSQGYTPQCPCNPDGSLGLKDKVPHELRLATAFLDLLGRRWDDNKAKEICGGKHDSKSQALVMAKQKIKPLGLLGTHFKKPLKYMDDEKEIVISAKTVETCVTKRMSRAFFNRLLSNKPLGRPYGPKEGIGLSSLAELYGKQEFKIKISELKTLEKTIRIRLGKHLPSMFYKELVGVISQSTLYDPSEEDSLDDPRTPLEFYNRKKTMPLQDIASEDPECELAKKLAEVQSDHFKYGFTSREQLADALQLSISELASEVCISQEGYFFVGDYNQITPKPDKPIHFIAACAPDFKGNDCFWSLRCAT
jgi:hypothetical protein